MIDPSIFTLVQTTFLTHINAAYQHVASYAMHLLYYFAAFELVVFGLIWAFSANADWSAAVFKIIKIGLVLFLLTNFGSLTSEVIRSFAQIGGAVVDSQSTTNFLFNPSMVWQYGYNIGLALLKLASLNSGGFGFPLVLILLGAGILLTFGLIGIQIVLQVVGFYLTALLAMIFIPFGVFNPASKLFSAAVQSVLKAGVRVFTMMVVIGLMILVLTPFDLEKVQTINQINQPLGVFFVGLLFLYFAIKLPVLLSEMVGEFVMHWQQPPIVTMPAVSVSTATASMGMSSMQQATAIQPMTGSSMQAGAQMMTSGAGSLSVLQSSSAPATVSPSSSGLSKQAAGMIKSGLKDAVKMQRSISEQSLKEIKNVVVS